MKTKIFASYLPQYYECKENNMFWGKGFTDWIGVKKAKPLFAKHDQPKEPLNSNYYDLSEVNTIKWQVDLAKKYDIDGFNIYHYWFENGHTVLEKPSQIILENKDININYFFTWDNTSWVRSWSNIEGNAWAPKFDNIKENDDKTLLKLDYGSIKDWKDHFDYLLPYFKDDRYFKIDGKPVFGFMKTDEDKRLIDMYLYWNELAKKNNFNGIFAISGAKKTKNECMFDYQFIYQPRFSVWSIETKINKYLNNFHIKTNDLFICDYSTAWRRILLSSYIRKSGKYYFGGFVKYDDTPRRGNKAHIIIKDDPNLFKKYFKVLYQLSCKNNKEILLLTAWNEWGEGAYLEPDKTTNYKYLEKIKEIKNEVI